MPDGGGEVCHTARGPANSGTRVARRRLRWARHVAAAQDVPPLCGKGGGRTQKRRRVSPRRFSSKRESSRRSRRAWAAGRFAGTFARSGSDRAKVPALGSAYLGEGAPNRGDAVFRASILAPVLVQAEALDGPEAGVVQEGVFPPVTLRWVKKTP